MNHFYSANRRLKLISEHRAFFALGLVSELIFFLLVGVLLFNFSQQAFFDLNIAQQIVHSSDVQLKNLQAFDASSLSQLSYLSGVVNIYDSLVKHLQRFFIGAFLFWMLFESVAWWSARRIAGYNENYFSYLSNFTVFSLIMWGGGALVARQVFYFVLKNSMLDFPLISNASISYLGLVIGALLLSFSMVGFASSDFRTALRFWFKNFWSLHLAYAFFAVLLSLPILGMAFFVRTDSPYIFLLFAAVGLILASLIRIFLVLFIKGVATR